MRTRSGCCCDAHGKREFLLRQEEAVCWPDGVCRGARMSFCEGGPPPEGAEARRLQAAFIVAKFSWRAPPDRRAVRARQRCTLHCVSAPKSCAACGPPMKSSLSRHLSSNDTYTLAPWSSPAGKDTAEHCESHPEIAALGLSEAVCRAKRCD